MKLSTEAKAGVMVAVSFLGLSGVLVGKKFLDPDSPIEALASEQKGADGKDQEKDKDKGSLAKKGDNPENGSAKPNPEKPEILLTKANLQTPGPFPPLTDANPVPGSKEKPGSPSSPPFNPTPLNSSGLPPLPGTENLEKNTGGANSLAKNDPLPAFPFPPVSNNGSDKKNLSTPQANSDGKGKSEPPPFPPSNAAFPAFPGENGPKTGDGKTSAFETARPAPFDKKDLPDGKSFPGNLGNDGKGKSGAPDPFPPTGTLPSSLPGFPPTNSQPSSLEKNLSNNGDNLKKSANELPPFGNNPFPNQDSTRLGSQPFPRNEPLAGSRGMPNNDPFPSGKSGASGINRSFENPSPGFPPLGNSTDANPNLNNTQLMGRSDSNLVSGNRPLPKPMVTTFSAVTGPAKRTEFVPLEETPAISNGGTPANREAGTPFPNYGGTNPSEFPNNKSAPPTTFPLPSGNNRDQPANLPGSGGLPANSGRPDPFPSNPAPNPNGFGPMAGTLSGTRPDPFPGGIPQGNPNSPVLKMPTEEKPFNNPNIQPAGLQFPGNANGPAGNSPPIPLPANLGQGNQPPAPANNSLLPSNNSLLPTGGKNLVAPKVSSWSEKVYPSVQGDTWESIAQKEYQRKDLARLLQTYNDFHPRADLLPKNGPLPPRTEVFLPPVDELIRRATGEVPMTAFPPNRP